VVSEIYVRAVPAILGAWLFMAILAQRRPSRILRYDVLGLLPNCRFFAPRPIAFDFEIYSRSFDRLGAPSVWKPLVTSVKGSWCCLWNPGHRLRKTCADLTKLLRQHRKNADVLHLSHPYLQMLSATTELYRDALDATSVQFAITRSRGYEDDTLEIIFLSYTHPLDLVEC
jgi:hypothetical protein